MTDRRQVVITGIGPITAFGLGIEPLWSALMEGRSAIQRITRFDASGFPCPYGAELPDDLFRVRDVVPKSYRKATKVMARDIELAVGSADAAVRDARLNTKGIDPDQPPTIDPDRFGCHIGAGLIASDVNELTSALVTCARPDGSFDLKEWGARGMENLTPLWLLKYLPNMLSCHVTIIHDCRGPSNTITCAEASSALSLGESMRVIERGAADACLTGGAEFKLNPMAMLRQHFAKRLAHFPSPSGSGAGNDWNGTEALIKPFDPSARGTILGEGGGILVVEAEESARARGGQPYCTITGFASSQSFCPDAAGLALDPEDESLAAAVENALDDAKVSPEDIDAIVPLGSALSSSDAAEASAIRRVFGPRANEIPLVLIVPSVGNCCAGAGAIGLSVAAKMLKDQGLPPSSRFGESGTIPCGPRFLTNHEPRSTNALRNILIMTTSLGGQNAAVVLSK